MGAHPAGSADAPGGTPERRTACFELRTKFRYRKLPHPPRSVKRRRRRGVGATAEAWGLASLAVDDEEVDAAAVALAAKVARGPAVALEFIKEMVLAGADLPLTAALALERKSLHLLFDSAGQAEGMAAFLEKRRPSFKGE